MGMQNDTVTEEESLAVSYKAKHSLLIQSQQSCSLVFTQMSWTLACTQKSVHKCLYIMPKHGSNQHIL